MILYAYSCITLNGSTYNFIEQEKKILLTHFPLSDSSVKDGSFNKNFENLTLIKVTSKFNFLKKYVITFKKKQSVTPRYLFPISLKYTHTLTHAHIYI